MTGDLWTRVEEVYHRVLACGPERRSETLDEICRDDLQLRREVESLLAARESVGDFLSPQSLFQQIAHIGSAAEPERLGPRLGEYEILERIGAGSMGEVYRARDTRLGREVALKVLHAHMTP